MILTNGNDMVQFSLGYVDNTVLDIIGSESLSSFGGQTVGSTWLWTWEANEFYGTACCWVAARSNTRIRIAGAATIR